MIEWILKIHPKPLKSIQEQGKCVEGRVPDPDDNDKDYELMEPGDYLRFKLTNEDECLLNERYPITYVRHYDSIEAMLREEGLENVLPTVESIEEGVQRYYSFPEYKQRAEKFGVYAIGLGDVEQGSE